MGQLQSIQALRAVAAMMVVIHHSTRVALDHAQNLQPTIVWNTGEAGVDLFFVISGLVMGISYFRGRSLDGSDFLRRRLIRIVPMYWIATTLKFLMLLFIPASAVHSRIMPWNTVASYLFISSKNNEGIIFPLLTVGWTLNFEMLFYLLFTVGLALRTKILPFLSALIGALAIAGLWRTGHWPAAFRVADPLLLEFLMGLWLASFLAKGLTLSVLTRWILFCLGVAGILLAPSYTHVSLLRVIFWGVPAAAIITAAAASSWQPQRWLTELGNASYAIYLFHGFVMSAMGLILMRIGSSYFALSLWFLGCALISALTGVAIYRIAERPLLRMINSRALRPVPAMAREH